MNCLEPFERGRRLGLLNIKHGHCSKGEMSPTYRSWVCMKTRCSNPKTQYFKYYGGKGIKVCIRWKEFKNFLLDMGVRPIGKSIDRIDGSKDYSPQNCKWSTPLEQIKNRIHSWKWSKKARLNLSKKKKRMAEK